LNRSQSCPRIYDKRINEKGNNIRLKMADVMMAESSSASLSRRQHLANTFEAYRAGLDADVSSPVFPVIES
jgi:hypothetical protein